MSPAAEPLDTWAAQFAAWCKAYYDSVPEDVIDLAALQLYDSLACASGAIGSAPVRVIEGVISGSGPPEVSLLFSKERVSIPDAILFNGTAIRYLDANDVFLAGSPIGHPSDNIPVALALGESVGTSGRDVLAAVAVSYEMLWRLRTSVFELASGDAAWDGVSVSGIIAATITALLAKVDTLTCANAISIAASKGYALREIRHGEISGLKAAANALVAREGAVAGLLAIHGMTGPPAVFEGQRGLIRTLGGDPTTELLSLLCRPPEWAIRRVSIKAYPAVAMAQSAIAAACEIAAAEGFDSARMDSIRIRLPNTAWSRGAGLTGEPPVPKTRESADHSIPFLVALALTEGDVAPVHFEREAWHAPALLDLLRRTTIELDDRLASEAGYGFPAVVSVRGPDGDEFTSEVMDAPGSPRAPWGVHEIAEKFVRLDAIGLSKERHEDLRSAVLDLARSPSMSDLLTALTPPHSPTGGTIG